MLKTFSIVSYKTLNIFGHFSRVLVLENEYSVSRIRCPNIFSPVEYVPHEITSLKPTQLFFQGSFPILLCNFPQLLLSVAVYSSCGAECGSSHRVISMDSWSCLVAACVRFGNLEGCSVQVNHGPSLYIHRDMFAYINCVSCFRSDAGSHTGFLLGSLISL